MCNASIKLIFLIYLFLFAGMVQVGKKHPVVLLKYNNDNVSVNLSGPVKVKGKKKKSSQKQC